MALARTPGEGLVCEFGDHRSVDHRTAHGGNCAVDTCPRSAWQWCWHCTAVTSRGALVHRPQYLRERLYRFRRERPCRSIAVALPENSKVGNGSRLCENAKFRYRVLAASAFGQPIRPRWVESATGGKVRINDAAPYFRRMVGQIPQCAWISKHFRHFSKLPRIHLKHNRDLAAGDTSRRRIGDQPTA